MFLSFPDLVDLASFVLIVSNPDLLTYVSFMSRILILTWYKT